MYKRQDDHRTTKVQGTGLGMAIARNIVNLMNGDIQEMCIRDRHNLNHSYESLMEQAKGSLKNLFYKKDAAFLDLSLIHIYAARSNAPYTRLRYTQGYTRRKNMSKKKSGRRVWRGAVSYTHLGGCLAEHAAHPV